MGAAARSIRVSEDLVLSLRYWEAGKGWGGGGVLPGGGGGAHG